MSDHDTMDVIWSRFESALRASELAGAYRAIGRGASGDEYGSQAQRESDEAWNLVADLVADLQAPPDGGQESGGAVGSGLENMPLMAVVTMTEFQGRPVNPPVQIERWSTSIHIGYCWRIRAGGDFPDTAGVAASSEITGWRLDPSDG